MLRNNRAHALMKQAHRIVDLGIDDFLRNRFELTRENRPDDRVLRVLKLAIVSCYGGSSITEYALEKMTGITKIFDNKGVLNIEFNRKRKVSVGIVSCLLASWEKENEIHFNIIVEGRDRNLFCGSEETLDVLIKSGLVAGCIDNDDDDDDDDNDTSDI